MKLAIFGASGRVGRLVVQEALDRGYEVVAFVHKNNPFEPADKLTVITGDVYSGEDVRKAIAGCDAVFSCLASWGRKTPAGNRNVLSVAMANIIPAMHEQNIKRIITLTGSGAMPPDQEMSAGNKLILKVLAPFPVGKVFADGARHIELLQASGLDWTTIRSPTMNDRPGTTYTLTLKAGGAFPAVGREAVASSMLAQLDSDAWLRKAPALFRA